MRETRTGRVKVPNTLGPVKVRQALAAAKAGAASRVGATSGGLTLID